MKDNEFRGKEIKFTNHAEKRMLERDIANHDVVAVAARPEDILYDTFTGREILVDYSRNVAVICEESADMIVVVTVLYSKNLKDLVKRRINSGRWIKW